MKKSTILIPLAALALSGCVFTPAKPSGGTTGGNPTSQQPGPGDSGTPQPGTSDSSGGGGQIDPTSDTSGTPTPQPGVTAVTFAEAKTIIDALEDGAVTSETYEVIGFVTGQITKSSKNQNQYWFNIKETESSTDEMVCYYLDGNGVVPLAGMQVKCTSQLRKYVKNSQVQYQLNEGGTFVKLADPVTPEPPTEAITVAQALEVINALPDAGQTSAQYTVRGYALANPEASTQVEGTYRFNIADEKDATSNSVQVYWLALEAGSEVPVKDDLVECTGYLKKFVKNSAVTPEIMNGTFKKVSDTPATPTVNSVSVNPTSVTKYTGDSSFTITPTVSVSGGAAQTVSWSVSQGDSVSVNNGTVSIVKAGVSKVRATSTVDSTKYAECTVTVNESAATKVTVTPASQTLQVNTSQAFSSSVEGVGNFTQFVTWSVIPASAGTITSTGMFTAGASAASDVKIRATSDLTPSVYGEATVQIQEAAVTPEITGITGLKASTSLEVGQSETLSATVQGVGAFDNSIDWVSADPTKVEVDSSGKITAVAATTTPVNVTASAHGKPSVNMSCAVTVTEAEEIHDGSSVEKALSPEQACDIAAGLEADGMTTDSYYITGVVTRKITTGTYAWSSEYGSFSFYLGDFYCHVLKNGEERAKFTSNDDLELGDTVTVYGQIIAYGSSKNPQMTSKYDTTSSSYTKIGYVYSIVESTEPMVVSVSIDGGDQSVAVDGSLTLSATVEVVRGAGQTVSWSSSNSSVATINSSSGVVTLVGEGNTTITATSTVDSTKTDSITLTVVASGTPVEQHVTITPTTVDDITQSGITLSFAKSSGSSAPAYTSDVVRLYANNTLTISSSSTITKIEFEWTKNPKKDFATATASVGSYTHPSAAGTGTWTGSASSIVFTVGSTGQLQLPSLTIYYQ